MTNAVFAATRFYRVLLAGLLATAAAPAYAQDYELVEWTTASFYDGSTAGTPVRYGNFKTQTACGTALAALWNGDASRWTSVGVSGSPTLGGEKPNSLKKDGGCFHVAPTALTAELTTFTLDAYFENPTTGFVTVQEVAFQTDSAVDCATIQSGTGALSGYMGDWLTGAIYASAQCN